MIRSESSQGASADLVRTLIGRVFSTLTDDVKRAQNLLRDAMPLIVGNFQGLQEQVRGHVEMVEKLAVRLQGNEEEMGFIRRMRVIIDTFVRDLISVSQQSVRIVERVTLMGKEVDLVIMNVGEIEEMVRTTRFIALNAHIEAHRSGEAGKSFRVVADEVKRLAGDAADFSAQIRQAIDRCRERLVETRGMVGVLASHDMTVALTAQSGLVETVTSIDQSNRELVTTLKDLDVRVRDSIRALQFDDILMQLLGSIGTRIALLQSVWLEALPPKMSVEDAERLINAYERHRPQLEARQAVTQTNLDTGSAELF